MLSTPITAIPNRPQPKRFGGVGVGSTPALHFNGKDNIAILPLENEASNAIVDAVRRFATLYPRAAHPDVTQNFVQAIHLCQGSLGSLRFWHSLNKEQARQRNLPPMRTPPAKLQALARWGDSFRAQVPRRYQRPEHRQIMRLLCDAWDKVVALTRRFEEQHVYDDFRQGLLQVDHLLRRLE